MFSGKRQLKHHKLTQNSVSFSCQSKQDSRCCTNFPHELTCQILTNQSVKIRRRAWPTGDHGEQSQKQLPSLPVIAGWFIVLCYSFIKLLSHFSCKRLHFTSLQTKGHLTTLLKQPSFGLSVNVSFMIMEGLTWQWPLLINPDKSCKAWFLKWAF